MTYIQLFIKKAIVGGWRPEGHEAMLMDFFDTYFEYCVVNRATGRPVERCHLRYEAVLLDPTAWQAVARVQKWYEGFYGPEWRHHMHQMIDARCERKTFEEFLRSIFEKDLKRKGGGEKEYN